MHSSPHDIPGYDEPLFPVADTPIGRLGCAICYDWLFPEAIRQLAANGAEVLIRVSAYMDPWGATEPMNWWTLVNRTRAIENMAYVVAANQGASLKHYPPYSWPGGSQNRRLRWTSRRGSVTRSGRAHRRCSCRRVGPSP
ncbi:MAG: nitrilase-related carbon-nitrogen hydrolase [Vicinamibacterales bacterium]